jgi:mono/diheme cytochrome c family protein
MKRSSVLLALASAAILLSPLRADAQKPFDLGKREYESKCAVCHGMTGKGDGPYMKFVAYKSKGTEDLTALARRNGGLFPFQRVYEYIDGTRDLDVHGPRTMPIWGKDYMREARDEFRDENYMTAPFDPNRYTTMRILALTDYLSRLQVK